MKELFWAREAYKHVDELVVEGQKETSICRMAAALIYQHGLGAAFWVERAAEADRRDHAVLTGSGTSAQAPGDILESLHYPDTLS